MKKLMITLSAAALAFGLYADGGPLAGEAFTGQTDVPATITTPGESSIGTTAFVPSKTTAGVPDQFIDEGEGNNLIIKTKLDAPAYYEPTELAGGVTMNGLFFDSMVKFTACDEDAVVPTGSNAKIMVWVKEDETAGTTNLMVTAGYFADTDNTIEAKNYDCGAVSKYGIDMEKWSRLTIKAYDEITTSGDGVGGFVLFVNATVVTIAKDKAIGVAGSHADSLTKVLKLRTDAVFPSLARSGLTTVTGVGFAGQGAVDDLSFTTKAPTTDGDTSFVDDPVPAIATVGGVDAISIEDLNAKIAAAVGGAAVVLVDDVTGDIVFANDAANTLDLKGFTLNGGFSTADGTGTTTLTLNDTVGTGSVEGICSIGGAENVLFNGGKIKADVNEGLNWYLTPATGMNLDTVDGYWQLVAPSEDGTTEKPWTIKTAQDLTDKLLANYKTLDAAHNNYVLTADIDMSTAGNWDGPGEHETTDAFTGVFDGAGYTIYGLTLAKKEYNGFFGNLAGEAQVKNLTIIISGFGGDDPEKGSYGAGGVTGYAQGTNVLIENVTVKGTAADTVLTGTHNMAGIGARLAGKITLKNCTNELNLATSYSKIGGMCAIASNRDAAGDITFDGCVNKGSITALENANHDAGKDGCAGILGYIQNSGAAGDPDKVLSIKNCQNLGVISTSDESNKSAKIASLLSYPQTCAYGELTGNTANADCPSVASGTAAPDGICFADVNNGVATFVTTPTDLSTKVLMSKNYPYALKTKADTVTFNVSVTTPNVTAPKGYSVATSDSGDLRTYSVNQTPIEYSLTYKKGAEALTLTPASYNVESETFTLPTYRDENYKYTWCIDSTLLTNATTTIAKGTTGNKTFYAKQGDALIALTEVILSTNEVEVGTTTAPTATVKAGEATVDAANYELTYSPELKADTAAGTVITVTATAKSTGDYKGTATATFTVKAKPAPQGVVPGEPQSIPGSQDMDEKTAQEAASQMTATPTATQLAAGLTSADLQVKAKAIEGGWVAVAEPADKYIPEVETTKEDVQPIEVTDTNFSATIKNAKKGFYYGFVAADELKANVTFAPAATFVTPEDDGELKLTAPKATGNARFYKLSVSAEPINVKVDEGN